MSNITEILANDAVRDSRAVINTNFENLNDDKVETLTDLGVTKTASEINNLINLPTGVIQMWPKTAPPTGFLVCDGTAVSRTTYADLFAVIGTDYGAGDSSTTFNLPNIRGRVPVGLDAGQSEFDALGETGGAKTHTLTINQIPSHDHGIPNGAQLWRIGTTAGAAGGANNQQTSPTFSAQGGGEAHNNLQPYIVLNYIIKT